MNKKVRIIKRVMPNSTVNFTIQQRHFLFKWWWVDAWLNNGVECIDSFNTLKEAQDNICYFNGTKCKKVVIQCN